MMIFLQYILYVVAVSVVIGVLKLETSGILLISIVSGIMLLVILNMLYRSTCDNDKIDNESLLAIFPAVLSATLMFLFQIPTIYFIIYMIVQISIVKLLLITNSKFYKIKINIVATIVVVTTLIMNVTHSNQIIITINFILLLVIVTHQVVTSLVLEDKKQKLVSLTFINILISYYYLLHI